jgi:hypothetical protein
MLDHKEESLVTLLIEICLRCADSLRLWYNVFKSSVCGPACNYSEHKRLAVSKLSLFRLVVEKVMF